MSQRTPLYDEHRLLNARMVDFAGWEMPLLYSAIIEEHNATRGQATLFDVCHMGEVTVSGPGAKEFLACLVPTDLDRLSPGRSMYTVLCNERGGIVDDLFIYMVGIDDYYLVVNAGTKDKDLAWLERHRREGVAIRDISDATAKIDLQGPRSPRVAGAVFGEANIKPLERFMFSKIRHGGEEIMISHTGYTGERGYEIYTSPALAPVIWKELLEKGKEAGIKPAGLGARDTLRLEACYSLYGHELNDDTTPVEAGLGWLVNSPAEYIAKDILMKQKKEGPSRTLVVFSMLDKGIPREKQRIFMGGQDIGTVTSGSFSPTFQKGIGMGLVVSGRVKPGDTMEIQIRDKNHKARVERRPLYPFEGKGADLPRNKA